MKAWILTTLAAPLLLLATVPQSRAYGPIGHETVGAIADARLAGTPAGATITKLLDGFTLEKAAVIPDEIKGLGHQRCG